MVVSYLLFISYFARFVFVSGGGAGVGGWLVIFFFGRLAMAKFLLDCTWLGSISYGENLVRWWSKHSEMYGLGIKNLTETTETNISLSP